MINQRILRFGDLALGAIFLGACVSSTAAEPTEIAPIPPASLTPISASATQIPATDEPVAPSETPQPEIDVFNIYIGKDETRQPELLENPMVSIVSINKAANFSGSYADIFLDGLSVTGNPILGGEEMLGQLILLLDEARQSGFVGQTVYSSYRSYEDQVFLTNKGAVDFLQDTGQFLAEPGRSEHQLGTAIDLGWGASLLNPYITFNNEAAGEFYEWVKANAHRFGFVFSYPFKASEDRSKDNLFEAWVTEYKAELWHIRYVSVTLATQIYGYQDEQGRNYLDTYSSIIPQQFYLP